MKYVITEEQSNYLLHDLLNEMFDGYREVWVKGGEKLVFVGDKLLMVWTPTKAILSKDILEIARGVLFYDTMDDFKRAIRTWFLERFPVSIRNANMYGFKFMDLSNYAQK